MLLITEIKRSVGNSVFDKVNFDPSSIFNAVVGLNKKSAPGPDEIPPILFKKLITVLVFPLTLLFNGIMLNSKVPRAWLSSVIVPIHKKGPLSSPSNYRPISLTNSCCKIFESVVSTQLLSYLHTHKLISPAQHGFLKNHSTCSNLLESLNDWSSILDKSNEVLIFYADFFKAFDSVSVPKLVFKLSLLNICKPVLDCIESLLNNRMQCVKVGSALSNPRPVKSGVQQGSVLGPLMFLLFITDIHNYLPYNAISKLFADDFKSYIAADCCINTNDFNLIITAVQRWADAWQLPLSIDKCKWMIMSNKLVKSTVDFSDLNVKLDETSEFVDLGVTFNSKLNFSSHISLIIAKAKQRLYLLRKCFTSCNENALVEAFKTYVIPLLEYCCSVWSPSSLSDILRLEAIQRSFTRSLYCCQSLSYKERLCRCNL